MQNLPTLEVMQRAIRAKVCPICWQRPPGSEKLGPHVPRRCEPGCTIFLNLPAMRSIVENIHGASMAPYEKAMRETICSACQASPTAGDFCVERTQQSCPLSRYSIQVIEALEQIPK